MRRLWLGRIVSKADLIPSKWVCWRLHNDFGLRRPRTIRVKCNTPSSRSCSTTLVSLAKWSPSLQVQAKQASRSRGFNFLKRIESLTMHYCVTLHHVYDKVWSNNCESVIFELRAINQAIQIRLGKDECDCGCFRDAVVRAPLSPSPFSNFTSSLPSHQLKISSSDVL